MLFNLPENTGSIIKVIGVGGGGSNAVTHMFKQGIVGVDFAICNTDAQAMDTSVVPTKIQLGPSLTEGRGAGSKPVIGRESCLESIEDVKTFFADDTKMLFITAGMGGGTGTGAAPVIAKAAQELDILTVGIVTLPFMFEGRRRSKQAMEGLADLKKNVDTLIVISNDKLREIHGNLGIGEAFGNADDILSTAAKGIAEIITVPGYVNVDFEDVNTVMRGSGVAVMGTASAEGEDRAKRAVESALQSPLLEDNNIQGAEHILLNITSGTREVTMDEVFEITEYVQEEAGYGTDLIWGNCYDEELGEKISVTVIATGFETNKPKQKEQAPEKKIIVSLEDDPNQPENKNVYDLGESEDKAVTFEFDASKYHTGNNPYTKENHEPYIKDEDKDASSDKKISSVKRDFTPKIINTQSLNEMENEPAYLRKNIKLDDVPHSSESSMSKWTLSEDDMPEMKENNSYLHDNVD